MMPFSDSDALRLIGRLALPAKLEEHLGHVATAASELVEALRSMGVPVDEDAVVAGARLHDIGKSVVQAEVNEPGNEHEARGRELLRDHGVPDLVARAAWVHGNWKDRAESLEDLLVTLADKLCRGARHDELERATVKTIAKRCSLDHWDVYPWFIAACDDIALGAGQRP